ncbi:protein AGENET DOMAIN (AGD)-CONTAINING P1 isoform X2 [Andrographis paniculata]|uniref:protein AGENET DOMAIN (AGD)-CONTAINING P1 isoform X2 n=1 Tax=Andrographis paniculata TaxID=175694 RepID=UPI0021E985A9|nr:protein AGENET DOMAIN (AGD)-CONTAINING P1 isoform X2 [Andrographis paniculata]
MASSSQDLSRYFKKGAEVEISSDDEGFRGSWFAGTVVRPPKSFKNVSAKVLVEYKTLMQDEKGKRPLREELKLVQLRPPPPRENRRSFKSSEDVDAYYNDGWWEGIVTEVLKNGEYSVFFRCSREQLSFKAADLRLHREWVHGKWVPPLERPSNGAVGADEKVPPSTEAKADNDNLRTQALNHVGADNEVIEHNFNPGEVVEVSTDEEGFEGSWFGATVIEHLSKGRYLIEYHDLKDDDDDDSKLLREEVDANHLRPRPPDVAMLDRFGVREQVDAFYNDGWWKGVVSKVLHNDKYSVYFESTDEEMKFNHSKLRVHQEWINSKWIVPHKVPHL